MEGMRGASGSGEECQEQKPRPGPSRSRAALARRTLTHSRSTEELRGEFRNVSSLRGRGRTCFRNRFFSRLRISRSRSVDRFRQIVEDYGEELQYTSVTDLRLALRNDPEASHLMGDTDVNELLQLIEQEMAQVALDDQAEQHEEETKTETDDILNRHLLPCKICQELCPDEGEICAECQLKLSDDMESH